MKRRTFSKKTGALGLVAALMPTFAMGKQGVVKTDDLTPAMKAHLISAKNEMNAGMGNRQHARMLKCYLEPVKIIRQRETSAGYTFSFQNVHHHTITLSSENGQQLTYIQP